MKELLRKVPYYVAILLLALLVFPWQKNADRTFALNSLPELNSDLSVEFYHNETANRPVKVTEVSFDVILSMIDNGYQSSYAITKNQYFASIYYIAKSNDDNFFVFRDKFGTRIAYDVIGAEIQGNQLQIKTEPNPGNGFMLFVVLLLILWGAKKLFDKGYSFVRSKRNHNLEPTGN